MNTDERRYIARVCMIEALTKYYDQTPEVRRVVNKQSFINDCLSIAGHEKIQDWDPNLKSEGLAGSTSDRMAVINKARSTYEKEATLQSLTTREAYVKDQLQQAKQSRALSDEEKKLVA